jgi:uncharacterized membrane-anchored protein
MTRFRVLICIVLASLLATPWAHGQDSSQAASSEASAQDAARQLRQKMAALNWVKGPTKVAIAGNSTLDIPEGYLFLDAANTTKFEELTHNLSSGNEVLVTPRTNQWVAYLEFSGDGLVKDDEKIDADAILASLRRNQEQANAERRRRGWDTMEVKGWAQPPAYNTETKRLEWATILASGPDQNVNFFTKILGRRGVTSVVLAADPADEAGAVKDLNGILTGYSFDSGERYADWKPGDKVAAIGLTGLIVGGAAVAAAKSGLLKGLVAALVAGWKFILAGLLAVGAWLRSLFSRKKSQPTP